MTTATQRDGKTVQLRDVLASIALAPDCGFPIYCVIGSDARDVEDYLSGGARSGILVQAGPMRGKVFQFRETPDELVRNLNTIRIELT